MGNPVLVEPVSGEDPCGPDLRWDPDFLALNDAFSSTTAHGEVGVVGGETVVATENAYDELIDMATALSGRTKDIRILVIHAEVSWRHGGLAAFAEAMEDLALVQETWPDAATGVHPRGDEEDGDLGERGAALGRLVNRIPVLAATVGWGPGRDAADVRACWAALRDVFERWTERFEPAFGRELPSVTEAWRALGGLADPGALAPPTEDGGDTAGVAAVPNRSSNAWDLIEEAYARMVEQDHHSPAVPLLRLLAGWRSLEIIDIVEKMKASGVTLEQLMESIKRQTEVQ